MHDPIMIVGSGFAAYQLVKNVRRANREVAIHVFTQDSGDEYNKPDISHVFSNQQCADDLVVTSAGQFAEQYDIVLHPNTKVEAIDAAAHTIVAGGKMRRYSKLVLATGARAFVPEVTGDGAANIVTLNSLQEYQRSQDTIRQAQRILVLGAGLIGVELAMDLSSAGKIITLVDPRDSLMSELLPEFVSAPLQRSLENSGVELRFEQVLTSLSKTDTDLVAQLSSGDSIEVDCVISAAGLKPNVALASLSGLEVKRGIVVDNQLQTSQPDIYALGDCAEIDGKVMAYLQPIVLSANALAKQLLMQQAQVNFPPMLVKVKTPQLPIQLGGDTCKGAARWSVEFHQDGLVARAYNSSDKLQGFVVTQAHINLAFPLLRELSVAT